MDRRFPGRVHRAFPLARASEGRGSPQPPRSLPSGSHTVSSWNFRRVLLAQGRQSALVGRTSRPFLAPTACARRPCSELRSSVFVTATGTVKAGHAPARSLLGPFPAVAPAVNPGATLTSAVFLPPLPSSLALHGSSCHISLALEPHTATRYLYIRVQFPLASLQSRFVIWISAPSTDLPPPLHSWACSIP